MALEVMERCISDLRTKWMYRDELKINCDKTEFLVIGSRQQLLKIHHCSVRVGTIDIKPVKVARNLGAWFDSHFSMSTHISVLYCMPSLQVELIIIMDFSMDYRTVK